MRTAIIITIFILALLALAGECGEATLLLKLAGVALAAAGCLLYRKWLSGDERINKFLDND